MKFSSFGARFWAWIVSARWTIGAGVMLVIGRVFPARDWLVRFPGAGTGAFSVWCGGRVFWAFRTWRAGGGRYLAGLFKWLNVAFSRRDCSGVLEGRFAV